MPVFALYTFDQNGAVIDDAAANGAQNGIYVNGATAAGSQLQLDGIDDFAKIYPDSTFQLDRGTLATEFTTGPFSSDAAQTVLSRDSVGENAGSFRLDVAPDGSATITHEVEGASTSFTTGPGFFSAGDTINLTYSWDQGGEGGTLSMINTTAGNTYAADVPAGLTMDMADQSQPWIVGAGQTNSHPDALDNVDQNFSGKVDCFSLSDTVDNTPVDTDPTANPDLATTPEDTPVVIDIVGNDTDPNGDPLTIVGGDSPNGTFTDNGDGTITYTPNPDFHGTDVITYTVADPDGNQSTSTVTVTVTPVNDDPVANPDTATTDFNTPVVVNVIGNDTDVDGDGLAVTGTPTSADGSVVDNGDGTVTFTPNDGFTGEAVIDYTITDGNGGTATSTVTITVGAPDRDGIVRGTDAANLIDTAYIDPFDADRVDANDAILGDDAPNDDRIYAGAGDDTVQAGLGDDFVRAGEGNDLVNGGDGNDDLRGNEGDDTLNGQNGSDIVYGQEGNDIIITGGTAQPLPDIDYPGVYAADTDPTNDLDTVYGGLGNDYISTGDDADFISGDDGRDTIDGGIDDDTILGGQGGDVLIGSEGRDSIDGGEGSDLIYGGLDASFPEALNIPDAAGDLRPNNNTDILFGGTGDDTIFGMDDDDTLYGGIGRDLLDGGVDEDSLFGDAGNDTILGGEGNDSAYGGDDRDSFTITTAAQGGGDFIDGNEGGDDYDTLDLTGAGPLNITYADDNPENGRVDFLDGDGNVTSTLNFINIENVIPCFTPGTLIATPKGEVPVEHLKMGDKIITRDNGIQEIRWVGAKALNWQDFRANPHLKPVLVKRGSLGNDLPEQDMMVSPNHRLLVANDRTALYFDEHEVLVSAKHLVGSEGVHAVDSIGTSYIHFMFDQHEVVLSNGAWTESFQPGDYTLKGMGNAQRSEILELFPELKSDEGLEGYTAARRTLKRHEARLLVR
ncbi:MAG: Hint domain-containing protein [Pseudomonadota bacterium]